MYFIDQWIIIWILLWKCCRNIKYEILKPQQQQQQQQQDFVCAFIYFWIYIYKLYEGNSEMNVLINWCPLNRMECGKEREQLGMEWDDSWPWTCTCSHIIMCDLWVGSRSMGASHHNGGWRWPGGGREVAGRWMNKRRFVSASASRWRRADACREMRPGSMRTDTHTAGAFRRSSGLWKSNKKMKKMKEMKKQKKISLDLYFAKCGLVWVAAQPTCLPLDIWIGFPFISFFFLMMGIDWSTNLFCVWGRIEPAVDWTRLFFFNYLMVRWRPVSDGVPSAMASRQRWPRRRCHSNSLAKSQFQHLNFDIWYNVIGSVFSSTDHLDGRQLFIVILLTDLVLKWGRFRRGKLRVAMSNFALSTFKFKYFISFDWPDFCTSYWNSCKLSSIILSIYFMLK